MWWARNDNEFGEGDRTVIRLVCYLDAWKSALVYDKEIVKKAIKKLVDTFVYSLPHPSDDLWETVDLANWKRLAESPY